MVIMEQKWAITGGFTLACCNLRYEDGWRSVDSLDGAIDAPELVASGSTVSGFSDGERHVIGGIAPRFI